MSFLKVIANVTIGACMFLIKIRFLLVTTIFNFNLFIIRPKWEICAVGIIKKKKLHLATAEHDPLTEHHLLSQSRPRPHHHHHPPDWDRGLSAITVTAFSYQHSRLEWRRMKKFYLFFEAMGHLSEKQMVTVYRKVSLGSYQPGIWTVSWSKSQCWPFLHISVFKSNFRRFSIMVPRYL